MNENPLATDDQTALESQAIRLLDSPVIKQARNEAAVRWRRSIGTVAPELEARFEDALEQAAFHGVLAGVNLDACRPCVHSTPHWPHSVAGRRIPATMTAFPNPDAVYRYMPVDFASTYLIRGRFTSARPYINEFSVVTRELETVANLSGRDLVVETDGTFSISIDPRPRGGRRNHLQTTPEAVQVLVRDMMADWATERPSVLTLSRMEGPPVPRPPSGEEIEEQAALSLGKHVRDLMGATGLALARPANTLKSPETHRGGASTGGFLVTQAYSWGNFRLEENEALVLTVRPGGAAYASVALSDVWSVTDDFTRRTVSFNHLQAVPDADGCYTLVLAAKDPGMYNWLDSGGSNAGVIFARWAGFDPARRTEADPSISAGVAKLSELLHILPPETRLIDAAGRREQIAKRALDYAWRRKIGD